MTKEEQIFNKDGIEINPKVLVPGKSYIYQWTREMTPEERKKYKQNNNE